jgi:FlaA1/EpsC-like NDP-sugar epimerase
VTIGRSPHTATTRRRHTHEYPARPPTSQPPLVLAMSLDAFITIQSMLVALLFRFDVQVPGAFWTRFWPFALFAAVVFVVLLFVGGTYRGATPRVVIATALIVVIATGVMVLVNLGTASVWARPVPPSVILLGGVLALVQLVALRLYVRSFLERVRGRGN